MIEYIADGIKLYRVEMGRHELVEPVDYNIDILAPDVETAIKAANQYDVETNGERDKREVLSVTLLTGCIFDAR